jgi:hypothetical protein
MDAGIVALLVSVGGAVFIPAATAAGKLLSQAIQVQTLKIGNAHWDEINAATSIAVAASEQMAKAGQISLSARKDNAMKVARGILDAKKVKLDDTLLSPLIEAKVGDASGVATQTQSTTTSTVVPTAAGSKSTQTTASSTTTSPASTPVSPTIDENFRG